MEMHSRQSLYEIHGISIERRRRRSRLIARLPIARIVAFLTKVKRAIESGDIRSYLDPLDLLRALIGVCNVASGPDWAQSAKRLVHILILGSRPIA